MPLAGHARNAQVPAEPGHLPGDPRRVVGMPETRVVGHGAEDVDVGGLRAQVDGEFLEARAAEVLVAPGIVEGPEQRRGPRASRMVRNSRTQSVKHVHPPPHPSLPMRGEQQRRALGVGVRQPDASLVLEPPQAAGAEARVGHVGHGLLPTGVAMVVVEPDAVDRESLQQLPERRHALRR